MVIASLTCESISVFAFLRSKRKFFSSNNPTAIPGQLQNAPKKDVKKRLFQRIFELEFMFWSVCHNAIKEFFKQCFEYFRITAVHCFRKCGFCHGFHAKVIKPFVVGKQSVFKFPAKNPCRKFEQRAKSGTVSMR